MTKYSIETAIGICPMEPTMTLLIERLEMTFGIDGFEMKTVESFKEGGLPYLAVSGCTADRTPFREVARLYPKDDPSAAAAGLRGNEGRHGSMADESSQEQLARRDARASDAIVDLTKHSENLQAEIYFVFKYACFYLLRTGFAAPETIMDLLCEPIANGMRDNAQDAREGAT